MCGIVGITGDPNVAVNLIEGLRRLEYRGYDSAGLAIQNASMYLELENDKKSLEEDIWSHRSWF